MKLEPISDLPTGLGSFHRAEWCRPEKAPFASPVDGTFRDVKGDRWTGDGTLCPPKVELAQHAHHGQSESQSAGGVGISTPCGEVSCVDGF